MKPNKKELITSVLALHNNAIRNFTMTKIAEAQKESDFEEVALWQDFYECLQEANKATSVGITLQDIKQSDIDKIKEKL